MISLLSLLSGQKTGHFSECHKAPGSNELARSLKHLGFDPSFGNRNWAANLGEHPNFITAVNLQMVYHYFKPLYEVLQGVIGWIHKGIKLKFCKAPLSSYPTDFWLLTKNVVAGARPPKSWLCRAGWSLSFPLHFPIGMPQAQEGRWWLYHPAQEERFLLLVVVTSM